MAVAMIGPKFYAWDRNGKPLAFGKLYTYQARTNIPKATYQSEDQVVANTNPVILNGEGYADIYLDGSYKMVLKDDKDNEIWSSDPVTASQPTEWVNCFGATYVSSTSFRIPGNQSEDYSKDRKVRIDNGSQAYAFSKVVDSSYAAGETTVIVKDAVVLTSVEFVCTSITSNNSGFNAGDLSDYTDYVFKSVDDMKAGNAVGGDVSFKEGDQLSTGGTKWLVNTTVGVDLIGWLKAKAISDLCARDFGVEPDLPDNTIGIQAVFDYVTLVFGGDTSQPAGYVGWHYPAIWFENGTIKSKTVTAPTKFKLRSFGQTVLQSVDGTGADPAGIFVNNVVTELDVRGFTFLYWDDVFITPTNNADFSFQTIMDCNIAYCNSLLDQVSFGDSRSTKTTLDNIRCTYGVPRIASIYSDVSTVTNSWLMHTNDSYLFHLDSFCKFTDNVIVPVGSDKTNRAVIFFEATDQSRSLLVDGVRFGGESGQSAILVIGDVNKNNANDVYRNQGVTIRRTDMSSNSNYDPDGIGAVNANVILLTPSSKNQSIQFLTIEDCYGGPDKVGGVIQHYGAADIKDTLNDDFVIELNRSSTLSFTRGFNKISSDDLKPYLATPILRRKYFGPGRGTGKIDVIDTATAGEKKITIDVDISYPSDYLTPVAFEVMLIGQSRQTYPSFGYAYMSKYIVALSGIFTSAPFARWLHTAVHESVGGISGDTNANINSVHWGSGDTGSADLALSGLSDPNQQVTIAFGTNMPIANAYVRPLYDFGLDS